MPLDDTAPLFETLDLTVDALSAFPDLAHDLCTGRFDVAIVRGVFSPSVFATVLERLQRDDHGMMVMPQHRGNDVQPTLIYGDAITPNELEHHGPPLERYHASAIQFRQACRRLFHGLPDYEARIVELFRSIAGGRATEVPRDGQGRIYTPSTIRRVPPGREINMHVGNYFLTTPPYEHLSGLLAPLDQLSFFLPISTPESGGAIEVYELTWQDARTPFTPEGHVWGAAVRERFRFASFAPGQGDMFLFNGGRYYHRVDFVTGSRPRWTIGGFLSFAKDDATLYYWG